MKKEIIIVKNIVAGTSTNAEGLSLFIAMDKVIAKGNIIVLSLNGCTPMSSSFLNSSIGALIEKHGFKSMKGQLILKNYTQVMADNIKHYLGRLKQLVHE